MLVFFLLSSDCVLVIFTNFDLAINQNAMQQYFICLEFFLLCFAYFRFWIMLIHVQVSNTIFNLTNVHIYYIFEKSFS